MAPVDPYRVVAWVGGRVAERRQALGLTQEQLAEQLDVSIKYLQRLEAGRENLTVRSMANLANTLDVAPSYLIKPPRRRVVRRPGRPKKRK